MPVTTITVESVGTFSGSGFWEVTGFDADQRVHKFSTNKPWQAALCDRAKVQGRPVTVHSRETRRWGLDIVSIELVDERASA